MERLNRERIKLKSTYDLLAKKSESARIAKAEETTDVRVASYSVVPDKKIKPKRRMIVILAGMIGFLVISFSVVMLKHVETQ